MTDLGIIKKCIDKIHFDAPYMDSMQPCIEAATRMSERIEDLERDLRLKEMERIGAMNAVNKWYNDYNELKSELAAAKPITCGECKLWHKFQCNFAYDDENLKATDFCSKAVRKEE